MRNILKQTSVLFLAQAFVRIIGFFYTIFLARNLGVSDFGLYSLSLAYFSIVSSFSDFGFNRFLIREIAQDSGKSWGIIWNVLMLRLTIVSVFFAFFAVGIYLLDPDKIRVSIILLASLAVLPQAIALTFDGIFIALQKLQFSAISAVALSFSTVIFGLFFINHGLGVMGAVNALILGQIIYAATLGFILYKHQGFNLSSVTVILLKKAFLGSLPYGLLGILGLLYFRIDTILLSYIKGSFETGIYGAAYKFLEAVTFIPSAFSMALFPVMARVHTSSPKDIRKLYFKSFQLMLVLGFIVFLGYFLILPEIIKIVLPSYLSSIAAIKILSLSIPFMFIHTPAVVVLLSTDKYLKTVLKLSILTLIFNIGTNLIFIPKFGFIAASWVTVVSEVLSFAIFFYVIKNEILDRSKK